MTTPQVDINQLRRQFPEEVVRYFDAVVAAKFQQVDWRIAAIEQTLTTLEDTINNAAISAANQAEARFISQALADLVAELRPYVVTEVDTEVAKWVYNTRTWARYRFYIDSKENIEALAEREKKMLYIGTEEEPDESSDELELTSPDDNVLSTDV